MLFRSFLFQCLQKKMSGERKWEAGVGWPERNALVWTVEETTRIGLTFYVDMFYVNIIFIPWIAVFLPDGLSACICVQVLLCIALFIISCVCIL